MELKHLQQYIKNKDHKPELKEKYFLKLIEEVGELAEVIRKNYRMQDDNIKNTIEEELYDVLYYTCAIANIYDIDLENSHYLKEELNKQKWGK